MLNLSTIPFSLGKGQKQRSGRFGWRGQAFGWSHADAWRRVFQYIFHRGKRYGFEIKFNDVPSVRKSMRVALNDLKLDHLWVIYPGRHRYPVDDNRPADNVKGQASAFILMIVDRILPFFKKNNVLRIISIVVNPSRLWPWLYLDSAPTLSAWSVFFAFPQTPWSFQFVW